MDEVNKCIAASFCFFVDDICTWAQGEDHCNEVTHTIAARINYLGQQNAPWKRREVSQEHGAWAGATVAGHPYFIPASPAHRYYAEQELITPLCLSKLPWRIFLNTNSKMEQPQWWSIHYIVQHCWRRKQANPSHVGPSCAKGHQHHWFQFYWNQSQASSWRICYRDI